jgi:hypothetical protein
MMSALDLAQALRSIGTPIDVHRCYWQVVRDAETRGLVVVAPVRNAMNAVDFIRVTPKPKLVVNK